MMKLLCLLLSTALLIVGSSSAHTGTQTQTQTQSPQHPTTTTTATTTVFLTVTQTVTHTETRTRKNPCPTGQAGILDFDDLATTTVSPMPLVYQDFNFPANSSWEYLTPGNFPASAAEFRSASSCPNGLLSRHAPGRVSFDSLGRSFSFDITSAAFFAFAPGAAAALTAEVGLRMADGYTATQFFDVQNAARDPDAGPTVLGPAELGAFKDLVEVTLAVWVSYDDETGEGVSAAFVLDDIEYVKRSCGTVY